jgi:hypothetical protein
MYTIKRFSSLFIAIIFIISSILQGCARPTTEITPTTVPTGVTASGVNLIPYDKNTTINTIQSPWKLIGPGGGGAIFVPTVSILILKLQWLLVI